MRQLILMRHAKSSWDNLTQKDFERPLNDRGHRDAPMMAKRLADLGIDIDTFITSPALRALTTAEYFAETFEVKKKNIISEPNLYLAEPGIFFEVVSRIPAKAKTVALFSHNPGITEFVNRLCNVHVDDMPTCAVFAVRADIKHWEEFEGAEKSFLLFEYPKK